MDQRHIVFPNFRKEGIEEIGRRSVWQAAGTKYVFVYFACITCGETTDVELRDRIIRGARPTVRTEPP